MTLSRTARILIAVLLLAAAAFFWVNFFYRDGISPVIVGGQSAPDAAGDPAVTSDGATEVATLPAIRGGAATETLAQDVSPADADGKPVDGATTVVIPAPEVVTRNVNIAELPFLVTEPPAAATGTAEAGTVAAVGRQQASRRISVNPFSPILIQAAAPAQTTPPATQPSVTQVTNVPIPGQPAGAGQTVASAASSQPVNAPAPRPLAPPAPRADGLPRQLPGGAPLASTPDILREARTVPEISAGDLGAVASVREPGALAASGFAPVGISTDAAAGDAPLDVLGPMARVEPAAPVADQVSAAPLAAGVDPLSRYLRDNNVVFTGSVRGPVQVGVFRSAGSQTPLVVSLGQNLPDTDIVLTDLTGMKAEFTQADITQVLSLDLRR